MAVNPDINRWQHKYADTEQQIEPKGEPELVEMRSLLSDGRALELACGKGANALYLAQQGFQVTAVDGAQNGLDILQRSAIAHGLSVEYFCHDLQDWLDVEERYDLICVIRYLNRPLLTRLPSLLAPGGMLFVKTFNQQFLQNKPDFNVDYVLGKNELSSLYSDLTIVAANETDEQATSSYILVQR